MTADTFTTVRDHLNAAADKESTGPVVRYQDGPLLPLSELGRTLCDSQIARLIIGADSEPLDLGRSSRLFTPAQRRAVIARDGGCAWDGCAMPARFCEVHHLDWWDDDHGHTDTRRGVLVCPFHHHELHRHHLDLTREEPPDTTRPRRLDVQGTALSPDGEPPGFDLQGSAPPAANSEAPPGTDPPSIDPALPGELHRRVTYRRVPRSQTRLARESAKRARLLADVRADTAARKAGREARGKAG